VHLHFLVSPFGRTLVLFFCTSFSPFEWVFFLNFNLTRFYHNIVFFYKNYLLFDYINDKKIPQIFALECQSMSVKKN